MDKSWILKGFVYLFEQKLNVNINKLFHAANLLIKVNCTFTMFVYFNLIININERRVLALKLRFVI